MKKLFAVMLLAAASFFASVANAAESNFVELAKENAPQLFLSWYLEDQDGDVQVTSTVFKEIQAALILAGWTIANDSNVAQAPGTVTRKLAEEGRHGSTRCFVRVRGLNSSNGWIYITMECGPADSYNNGVFVRGEFNNMTSRAPAKDGPKVPAALDQMYTRYLQIKARGLHAFFPKD